MFRCDAGGVNVYLAANTRRATRTHGIPRPALDDGRPWPRKTATVATDPSVGAGFTDGTGRAMPDAMVRPLPIALFVSLLAACAPPTGAVATPDEAARYLEDRAFRRETLEGALWRPDLPYSRSLLSSYALPAGGWERLPLQSSRTAPFTRADADALARGEALALDDGREIAVPSPTRDPAADRDADAPSTDPTWRALGATVFERLPMRGDAWLDWLAARPALWDEAGLSVDEAGRVRGLVRFADARGRIRVGLTCAGCHAGDGVPGRGDRRLNLGRARALYAAARGLDATALDTWGPGRVDVTDTDSDDPTAIPDLFHVGEAGWLNHSGVVRVVGRSTLAIRFETQFVQGHLMQSRPERRLMWALASYVASLGTAASPVPAPPSAFTARCAGCHDPARAFGGDLVPAGDLRVDGAVARDPERGTGYYKIPGLLGVSRNAPYLHDGAAPTLDALLAAGHPSGDAIPPPERTAILAFLNTL
jgi:cytochrome c553